jgi:hypothetical protein
MSEILTFTSRLISSGVLHVKGFRVIMAGESDMATYTGEGVGGRISSSGIETDMAQYSIDLPQMENLFF